ncbi:MAG TPA: ribonuclease HI family protein [Thermoanaerobaculia bacterium]|nr:ribonuclease HI family protein [Thermoanaerobaculia bacterium]
MPGAAARAEPAAAPARRGRDLRRLPPVLLPREGRILKGTAFIDGAARGNPGPAGWGAMLRTEAGERIAAWGFIGTNTNNVAEYGGLLAALRLARDEGVTDLEIVSDSQLLVRQMLGEYRVKHPNLVPLFMEAQKMRRMFAGFRIRHVLRAENKEADRLANRAVDSRESGVARNETDD